MRTDTIGAIVAHSWTIRFPAHRSAYKHILIEEYSKWTEAPAAQRTVVPPVSPAIRRNSGDGERDRSCCSPLFCDLLGHLLQKCGDLFDVVGRYLGRTEHARRLRLFRAEHVDRLLEHRDVERFRAPRQVLMPRFSSLLYL